jgi:hypothetical protein
MLAWRRRCFRQGGEPSAAPRPSLATRARASPHCARSRPCDLPRIPALQVIIDLLRAAMIKSGAKEFLIDGFPRAMDQAVRFEEMIKPCK